MRHIALCVSIGAALTLFTGAARAGELERLYVTTTGDDRAVLDAELARFTGRVLEARLELEFAGDQAMESIYADCAQALGTNAETQRECRLRAANRVMVAEVLELEGRRLARGRYELTLEVWSPESNGQRFAAVLEHDASSLDIAAREGLPRLAERYLCWRGDAVACAANRDAHRDPGHAPTVSGEVLHDGVFVFDRAGIRTGAEVLADHELACVKRNAAEDCFALAAAHIRGDLGLASRPIESVPWLERACGLDHAEACYVLAEGHREGSVIAADAELRARYLEQACGLEHEVACAELDALVLARTAEELDAREQAAALARSCERDSGPACTRLGAMAMVAGRADATTLLEKGCDLDDGEGCRRLAVALQVGHGGESDAERALALYDRACSELDDLEACVLYGQMIETRPTASDRSLESAIEAYARACEDKRVDRAVACWHLGDARDRLGKARRTTRLQGATARAWARACDLGHVEACRRLGSLYHHQLDDPHAAWEPYRKACTRGDDAACVMLEGLADEVRASR